MMSGFSGCWTILSRKPCGISGTGNSLTKTNLGTLRMTGAANTYTGNFQLTDGTVILDKELDGVLP